jgi:general secretion pathway protein L
MSLGRDMGASLSRGLDDAASAALSLGRVFGRERRIELLEVGGGRFAIEVSRGKSSLAGALHFVDGNFVAESATGPLSLLTGAEIEIVLAAPRFLFRTLELPEKAHGFLDAIVSGQIDRLTPWIAAQAAFGRGASTPISGGRLAVTVAATALSGIAPFVDAARAFKPKGIVVSVAAEASADRIVVLARRTYRDGRLRRARSMLVGGMALAVSAAMICSALWLFVGGSLSAARDAVERQISERRADLAGRRGVAASAASMLAQRKRQDPSSVVILEQLSRALPDDTYLTRMKIEDGKLEIAGQSREAPSLIEILEQTGSFRRATFSAPTTQAAGADEEQFQIEAEIGPKQKATR